MLLLIGNLILYGPIILLILLGLLIFKGPGYIESLIAGIIKTFAIVIVIVVVIAAWIRHKNL